MKTRTTSREVRLASRPRGMPTAVNFALASVELKALQDRRDWMVRQREFEREFGGYFRGGKLKSIATMVEGIDQAVSAFIGLFSGKNIGKMVVKLA